MAVFHLWKRQMLISVLTAAAICVFSSAGNAAALSAYAGRVRMAIVSARSLSDELNNGTISAVSERQHIDNIRKAMPPTETIDTASGTVVTDNAWLGTMLDDYEDQSKLIDKQNTINAICERLAAIEFELNEYENAAAAQRTKDEDKQKLAEILKREEYQKVEKKDSPLTEWFKSLMEWLDNMFPKSNIKPADGEGFLNFAKFLQYLIYAVVIAGIGYILYRVAPLFSDRFKRRAKHKKTDRIILGERVAADESANDLFTEAENLARAGDLRSAIRKGYIAMLCDLSDRRMIGLARHKTNRDYLRDVKKQPAIFTDVSDMTGEFERHWYGSDESRVGDWESFKAMYGRVIRSAPAK